MISTTANANKSLKTTDARWPGGEAGDGLAAALRARRQRVTPQRLAIAHALRELDRHVTADELLQVVAERLPGVSLPTVYATLDVLEDLGQVRRVAVTGGAMRYEPWLRPHHHALCRRCGAISDVMAPVPTEAVEVAAAAGGFAPEHSDVVVSGLCAGCR